MRDRHQRTHRKDTDAGGHRLDGPGKMPGSHREADREPRSDLLPGVKEAGRCTGISRTPPKSPERTDEPDGIDQHIRQEHANQAPAKCALDMRSEEHTSELQSLMRISSAVF